MTLRAPLQSSASLAAAIAVLILLASVPQSHVVATTGASHQAAALAPRPASMGLSGGPVGAALATPPPPTYDEQLGSTFTQDFNSLAYNVTAVAQTDSERVRPRLPPERPDSGGATGIRWASPTTGPTRTGATTRPSGSATRSTAPTARRCTRRDGGAGLGNFSGVVHSGDSVLLSLTFVGSTVQMLAQDWNTGATADGELQQRGVVELRRVTRASPTDDNGFFTGLMTEWYHVAAYYRERGAGDLHQQRSRPDLGLDVDRRVHSGMSTAPALFDSQTQSPVALSSDGTGLPRSPPTARHLHDHTEFVTGTSGTSTTLTLTPATPSLLLVSQAASGPAFSATYTWRGSRRARR